MVKKSTCQCRRCRSIPGLGRSPGEGNDNPLQYSCLENPMDRGAWWAIIHGDTKSQTRLSSSRTAMHNVEVTIVTIFQSAVSGVEYIYSLVQLFPPPISRLFSYSETGTLIPVNNNFAISPPRPELTFCLRIYLILWTSFKWNHIKCMLLCLAHFP